MCISSLESNIQIIKKQKALIRLSQDREKAIFFSLNWILSWPFDSMCSFWKMKMTNNTTKIHIKWKWLFREMAKCEKNGNEIIKEKEKKKQNWKCEQNRMCKYFQDVVHDPFYVSLGNRFANILDFLEKQFQMPFLVMSFCLIFLSCFLSLPSSFLSPCQN